MLQTCRFALLLALLNAAPLALSAQSASQEDAPSAPEALSLGEEALPEPYIKAEVGDWQVQCLRAPDAADSSTPAKEPCQLFQILQDSQGTNVAEVTIFPLAQAGQAVAGANVLVPLETLLSAQLTIQIDSATPRRYPYSFCSPIGCFARVGFTAQDIDALKKGAVAKVLLRPAPAPDEIVTLDMSLKGFTAGYDSLLAE